MVGALNQEAAGHIIDYLRQPPVPKKYEGIKTLNGWAKAVKLLHMDGPGDRKLSVLMNEMLALLDGHKTCLLFEQIFS